MEIFLYDDRQSGYGSGLGWDEDSRMVFKTLKAFNEFYTDRKSIRFIEYSAYKKLLKAHSLMHEAYHLCDAVELSNAREHYTKSILIMKELGELPGEF